VNRFDLQDDDTLIMLLGEALTEVDPVPDQAVTTALALAQLDEADDELATLVADSLVDTDVVLFRQDVTMEPIGQAAERLLTFATSQLSVDIDLGVDGATLVGALTPPMLVAVDLETSEGTVSTESDELGRFHLVVGAGRCRLRIHADGGAVVTPWITR